MPESASALMGSIAAAYEASKNTPVVPPLKYPVGSRKHLKAIEMGCQIKEAVRRLCCEAGFDL